MGFFSKDEQVRIDETFAWIVAKVPANERNTVGLFLRNWLARTYGAGGGIGQRAFSEALSARHANNAGDRETRAGRRALVILRGDLLNAAHPLKLTAAQAMAMPSVQVAAAVNGMLPNFRLFAQQEERVNTALQLKLNQLSATPEAFLGAHEIMTQSAPSATGIGQAEAHRFFFDYDAQKYWLVTLATTKPQRVFGNGITIQAVNVPEMFWFRVPGRNRTPAGSFARIPCTELTGADLMVTSTFNGCCFAFKHGAGGVFAAHVSPDGREAGHGADTYIGAAPTLAHQIGHPGAVGIAAGTGNFDAPLAAQAGALQVFGRGYSNLAGRAGGYYSDIALGEATLRKVCILGSRIAGNWQFVVQEFGANRAPITGRLL